MVSFAFVATKADQDGSEKREVLPKRTLVRLVRTADGVRIDPSGKMAGRGAYLHDLRRCWEKALKGSLANALRTTINEQERAALKQYSDNLPPDPPVVEGEGRQDLNEQTDMN